MNILVTNDDGIHSPGLAVMAEALSAYGDVYVSAPDSQRSACSHGITMHVPLIAKEQDLPFAKNAWAISGTPADCVKLAVRRLAPSIDLIFSGINHGSNLGTDAFYSGTVAGAAEGVFCEIPSVAMSICDHHPKWFAGAGRMTKVMVEKVIEHSLEKGMMLNVNIPNIPEDEIRGIKVTKLGVMKYDELFGEAESPFGQKFYWYGGNLIKHEQAEDVDVEVIRNKYVSVTPMHFDLTYHKKIKEIESWNLKY